MTQSTKTAAPALVFTRFFHPSMTGRGEVNLKTRQGLFYTKERQLLLDADYYFGEYTEGANSSKGQYVVVPISIASRRWELSLGSVMRFFVSGSPEFFKDHDSFFKWRTEQRRQAMGK